METRRERETVPFSSAFALVNCDWVSGRFVAGFGGRQESRYHR